jgi:hypothetical protein
LADGVSRTTVAAQILSSTEYRADLVNSYYETYFGRSADAAGSATWVGLLSAGASDESVQGILLGSAEYFGLH